MATVDVDDILWHFVFGMGGLCLIGLVVIMCLSRIGE